MQLDELSSKLGGMMIEDRQEATELEARHNHLIQSVADAQVALDAFETEQLGMKRPEDED
jgi:hypothetical protein